MRNSKQVFSRRVIFTALFTIFAANAVAQDSEFPDWFLSPPSNTEEFIYVTAAGESAERSEARLQAELDAKSTIQNNLGEKFKIIQMLFEAEVTGDYSAAFKKAEERMTSQELKTTVTEFKYLPKSEEGYYTVFLLMEAKVTDILHLMESAFAEEKELYELLRTSVAYEDFLNSLHRME